MSKQIKGRVAKFRINPGLWNPYKPGFGHYYDVHVFDDLDAMHEYAISRSECEKRRIERGDRPEWVGLVQPIWKYRYDKNQTSVICAPKVGDIYLWKERLNVRVVSHEAVHAATSFLRLKEKLQLNDQIDDDEECLAHCIGTITSDIYSKLYELKIL